MHSTNNSDGTIVILPTPTQVERRRKTEIEDLVILLARERQYLQGKLSNLYGSTNRWGDDSNIAFKPEISYPYASHAFVDKAVDDAYKQLASQSLQSFPTPKMTKALDAAYERGITNGWGLLLILALIFAWGYGIGRDSVKEELIQQGLRHLPNPPALVQSH